MHSTITQFGIPRALFTFAVGASLCYAQIPMGTAFSYQGQLKRSGAPVHETVDFEFSIWDLMAGGSQLAPPELAYGTEVVNGFFTVTLDFGPGMFDGSARWLEVRVRGAGEPGFTTLLPRDEITPSAAALYAEKAALAVDAERLEGRAVGHAAGQIPVNDGVLCMNLNADRLDGMHVTDLDVRYVEENELDVITSPMIMDDQIKESDLSHNINATLIGFDADRVDGMDASDFAAVLHDHSVLDASDGYPQNMVRVDADGKVGIGGELPIPGARLYVSWGSIAQWNAGLIGGYGKTSVYSGIGTLDGSGDFSFGITESNLRPWMNDNYTVKVEVFVSLDYNSSFPHTNKGSAYSLALIGKERGAGLTHFHEKITQSNDAVITFAYSAPVDSLRIDVDTNRPAGTSYHYMVKISH